MEFARGRNLESHPIAWVVYQLRVATLEYVRANLDSPDVFNALNWIRTSYNSGLPADAPGDEAGDFSGLLVQSMQTRLTEYANLLLSNVDAVQLGK